LTRYLDPSKAADSCANWPSENEQKHNETYDRCERPTAKDGFHGGAYLYIWAIGSLENLRTLFSADQAIDFGGLPHHDPIPIDIYIGIIIGESAIKLVTGSITYYKSLEGLIRL
jgi:hypothetical protein